MKKQGSKINMDAEDWCFVCKDGGEMRVCDYEGCNKVYHAKCVGKKRNPFLISDRKWICDKHSCSVCRSGVDTGFSCLLCTYSACESCYENSADSEIQVVRGKEKVGLCGDCLELVRLAEANVGYDQNGDKLDFEDVETYECGFKEYWEDLKKNEGLGLGDFYSPEKQRVCENGICKDNEDDTTVKELLARKHAKRKLESSDNVTLFDEDEDDVTLSERVRRRLKKQKLVRSSVSQEKCEVNCEERNEQGISPSSARNTEVSCFAAILASNMKLVYLRKSLVQKLLSNQPENFAKKVVGSFVRVENDPEDYFQGRSSHQLTQVKGIIRKHDTNELLLQLCSRDVPISLLSDCDFTNEDCEDYEERVEKYLVRRPTVVEIEQKARELRQDIKRDWFERELARLDNQIQICQETVHEWIRKELCTFLELRERLKQLCESETLFQHVPLVIPEVLDLSAL